MRKMLEVNEQLARDYFSARRTAPDPGQARLGNRINGDVGLGADFDPSRWQLQVAGLAAQDDPLALSLDAVTKLPRVEMTTESSSASKGGASSCRGRARDSVIL